MMRIEEGKLVFEFEDSVRAIKFDETNYYKKFKDCMDGNKGVDILAYNDKKFVLIEIKNFTGYENNKNNIRRLMTSSSSKVETLDREVSEKVRSTIAALLGSHVKQDDHLNEYFEALKGKISNGCFVPTIDVILFVEGDIKQMVRKKGIQCETKIAFEVIRNSMKRQLRWLTDRVSVENTELRREQRFFSVERI